MQSICLWCVSYSDSLCTVMFSGEICYFLRQAPSQHAALVSSIYISKPIAVIYPDLNSYFTQSDPCVRILERDGKQGELSVMFFLAYTSNVTMNIFRI